MNTKARSLEVRHGMTRTELDGFDGLAVVHRSLAEERAVQAALLQLASSFTPRAQICAEMQSKVAPFVFVLDMTGTERIFGPIAKAAQRIRDAVKQLSLTARLATSSNFQAALCAAAYAFRRPAVIPPGREREALKQLPLAALGLTEEQHSTFALWGLRTVGELANLPESELIARLGQQGKRLRALARGEQPHLMVPEEPVFTLEEYVAFDAPVDMLDSLLFVLSPMLEQLLQRAAMRALSLASVTVELTLEGEAAHMRTVKPALPLYERDVLLKLLQLDLQANPPAAGILAVRLHAEPGKRGKVQAGLFSPALPEPMRLDVTLARIAALVGEGRVGSAKLLDTHRPEGFVMDRFTVPSRAPQADAEAKITRPNVTMRRLRPGVPLNMWLNERAPAAFFFRGKRYTVAKACGPWRRSGEWWSEGIWSREEWDVCAHSPAGDTLFCLLMQDLLHGQWKMEALYD